MATIIEGLTPTLYLYTRIDYADVCKLGHEYACARGIYASRPHLITVAKARMSLEPKRNSAALRHVIAIVLSFKVP